MDALTALRRVAGRVGLVISKHSPEILMGLGVIGVVTSTVLASKATLKLKGVMEDTQAQIDIVKSTKTRTPDKKEYASELAIAHGIRIGLLVRLYGPAAITMAGSIACLVGSNRILSKRNVALIAAYKLVDTKFKDYRLNVINDQGEEKDRQYSRKFEPDTNIVPSKGNKEITQRVVVARTKSIYARTFQEDNPNWARTRDYNLLFLNSVQNWMNDLLKGRGHVFLNEVYDMLGLTRTAEGQAVGWVYDTKRRYGDNYIDFGILDPDNQIDIRLQQEEVNHNPPILLDFNVDGVIWDLI